MVSLIALTEACNANAACKIEQSSSIVVLDIGSLSFHHDSLCDSSETLGDMFFSEGLKAFC
jgi:hypothetical protein